MRTLGVLFGAFALSLTLAYAANAPKEIAAQDPETHRKALAELRQRIQSIQAHIRTTQDERSSVNQALRVSEQRISQVVLRLRDLLVQQARKKQRLNQLKAQAHAQQTALRKERTALARQVRAAYAMGRQEKIKIILNQEDPAAISRVVAYYGYLNRERIERMRVLRQYIAELAETRSQITAQQTQLQHLLKQQEAQKQAIEQEQQKRREVMRRLDTELAQQGIALKRLHSDAKHLEKLLNDLHKALADVAVAPLQGKKFAELRGQLNWPIAGRIKRTFGSAKIGQLRWDGVMIDANEGMEIRATHHGRVAFADWFRGFGLLLIIEHGDGYMSLYGHSQSLFKEVGDWVEAGEPIALAGRTGGRKKSGVYFAIRHNGRAINPAKWCKRQGKVG